VQIVSTPGWAKAGVFVTPCRTYPPDADLVANFGGHMANHRFAVSGSLKRWQTEVAAPLRKNSTAMFGVMVAFAGPLMKMLKIESGGFHLVGPSSIGKSSIIAASGSVWGGGGPLGFAQSYSATRNFLIGVE
jgi:putative DNA primase/helicase